MNRLATHPDGYSDHDKLLLARFRSDGSLDPGFGTDGYEWLDDGPTFFWAESLHVEPDGNFLLIGRRSDGTGDRSAIRTYSADGALLAERDLPDGVNPFRLSYASDGQIYGWSIVSGASPVLVRLR